MKTILINGSPKNKLSASGYFLAMQRLFLKGGTVNERLRNKSDHERILGRLTDADTVIFGLPLYVDGPPSHVLSFLREMEVFCRDNHICLNVYVISNSGFIEGKQNRPLLGVFENFCARSGLNWGGGVGVGGGVMLNVLRILFFVQIAILLLNIIVSGARDGNWLPLDAWSSFFIQMLALVFFNLGVLWNTLRMGISANKGQPFGQSYTRILIPSFIFIIFTDLFFFIISIFKGGVFKGWLSKK